MAPLQSRHFHADDTAGTLVIGDRRRVAPALIGAPFLATGLGLWGLIGVLVASHARAGSLAAPGGYLPMVGILLLGGAPFLWAGARLTLHNHSVRIRRGDGTVEEIDSYVVYRRVRRRRLSEFSAVRLRRLLRSRSGSNDTASTGTTHTSLSLDLAPAEATATPVRLAFDYDDATIRELAALASRATGLPVSDQLQQTQDEV